MSQYFEEIMSKHQCGFWKGHSAQHALISLLEKWRNNVDQRRMFGALSYRPFKGFGCLPHDIFIANLYAYGFDIKGLLYLQLFKKPYKRIKTDNA